MISVYLFVTYFFAKVLNLFINMDPAYMDLIKIFAGSIGWVGGLTLFMWFRERKRETERALARERIL